MEKEKVDVTNIVTELLQKRDIIIPNWVNLLWV